LIAQIVYLTAAAENREALILEALENARQSRLEEGIRRFDVLQQSDDPNRLILYEVYDSPETLEAHRQTIHFKRWHDNALPLLSKPRERTLFQVLDPQ
jgi:(4S)-4-hydroxy-5-phosphonooxypentane-2,3-dione isomerase